MSQTKAQLISDLVQALNFTGTASAPANGLFLSATNTLQLSTASTPRLTINSDGHVDVVGNLDVGAGLDVTGNITATGTLACGDITSSDGNGNLTLKDNNHTGSNCEHLINFTASDDTSLMNIGTPFGSNNLFFKYGSTELVSIGTNGQVDFAGNVDCNAGLDVTGSVAVSGSTDGVLNLDTSDSRGAFVRFGQGGSFHNMVGCADGLITGFDKEDLGIRATDSIGFATNGDNIKMTILSGGNVGIGTTSPSRRLHVAENANDDIATFINADTTNGYGVNIKGGGSASGRYVLRLADGANTDVMRVLANGNVGIGDTSPEAKLEVASADSTYALKLTCSENVSGSYNGLSIAGADENSGSYPLVVVSNSTTHETGGHPILCCTSRKVGIGTLSPNSSLNIHGVFETNAFEDTNGNNGRYTPKGLLIGDAFSAGKSGTADDRNSIIWNERGLDIDFATNDTVRMTLDHEGKLGIGTNSPVRKVHLHEGTSGNNFIAITNSTTGATAGDGIIIGMESDESLLIAHKEANDIVFHTSNTPRVTIKSTGHVALTSGNLEFASGAGIDFSAVSDGSRSVGTDGNKFDDYEEGTFTPTLGWSLTPTTANGRYTKIGRMVYYTLQMVWPSTTNLNYAFIGSLPFDAMDNDNAGGGFIRYTNYTGGSDLTFHQNNNDSITLYQDSGATITNGTLSGKRIDLVGFYIASV